MLERLDSFLAMLWWQWPITFKHLKWRSRRLSKWEHRNEKGLGRRRSQIIKSKALKKGPVCLILLRIYLGTLLVKVPVLNWSKPPLEFFLNIGTCYFFRIRWEITTAWKNQQMATTLTWCEMAFSGTFNIVLHKLVPRVSLLCLPCLWEAEKRDPGNEVVSYKKCWTLRTLKGVLVFLILK